MQSYHELDVYNKSVNFVVLIYQVTRKFPSSELYALTSQIQRAAVSIPSNIAEGFDRNSLKDYVQFLHIAYGSTAEVETQLEIAFRLEYLNSQQKNQILAELINIRKMLHKLIISIKTRIS